MFIVASQLRGLLTAEITTLQKIGIALPCNTTNSELLPAPSAEPAISSVGQWSAFMEMADKSSQKDHLKFVDCGDSKLQSCIH